MANCNKTQTGLVSLYDGDGLYEGGNEVPAPHFLKGQQALDLVDKDETGRYHVGFFGFSNFYREIKTAGSIWSLDKQKRLFFTHHNFCIGGYDTKRMAIDNPADPKNYWVRSLAKFAQPEKVRVAFVKIALARPGVMSVAEYIKQLEGYATTTLQILKKKYTGVEMVYLVPRVYGGYATSSANPEPYAHAGGQTVKNLVAAQINGDPDLSPAKVSWLGYGPYPWADGLRADSRGLTWTCADFVTDGTHPSIIGRNKFFYQILNPWLTTNPLTRKWYLGFS